MSYWNAFSVRVHRRAGAYCAAGNFTHILVHFYRQELYVRALSKPASYRNPVHLLDQRLESTRVSLAAFVDKIIYMNGIHFSYHIFFNNQSI